MRVRFLSGHVGVRFLVTEDGSAYDFDITSDTGNLVHVFPFKKKKNQAMSMS